MADQFICRDCKSIVVVPSAMILSEHQKAALSMGLCRDCAREKIPGKVKRLHDAVFMLGQRAEAAEAKLQEAEADLETKTLWLMRVANDSVSELAKERDRLLDEADSLRAQLSEALAELERLRKVEDAARSDDGCLGDGYRLVLENGRLRAEVGVKTIGLKVANDAVSELAKERDQLLDEADSLRAQVATLERNNALALDDLAALLRALGLGDHARPESPHEVMLQAVEEAARLRAQLSEARALQDSNRALLDIERERLVEARQRVETLEKALRAMYDEWMGQKDSVPLCLHSAYAEKLAAAALAGEPKG